MQSFLAFIDSFKNLKVYLFIYFTPTPQNFALASNFAVC